MQNSSSKSETSKEEAVEAVELAESSVDLMAELNKLTEEFVYVQCECAINMSCMCYKMLCSEHRYQ